MVIFSQIWISNGRGALYFFENVPADEHNDKDISEWFERNEIDIILNLSGVISWGALTDGIYKPVPETGAWK